ncbi:unnamed protein product [Prorocentrum cordatum]|uniref:Lipid desaturase domain-containing protein n=1 Tax=Prorocentrum cordatum TaxID=2364126 RepID=A0ABN9SEC3_9DINO|nr:unnamed protein product [Polarella glacialis]
MPPEWLPAIVQFMQGQGLLLGHERHMSHHEDLEHQFTILSGHADAIMDRACRLVPPVRYDVWFLIGVLWFLLPILPTTSSPTWRSRGAVRASPARAPASGLGERAPGPGARGSPRGRRT